MKKRRRMKPPTKVRLKIDGVQLKARSLSLNLLPQVFHGVDPMNPVILDKQEWTFECEYGRRSRTHETFTSAQSEIEIIAKRRRLEFHLRIDKPRVLHPPRLQLIPRDLDATVR